MARGKKYNDDIKEKAFALLAVNNNVQSVANELGLKYSTVKTWEKQFLAKSKESKTGGNVSENEKDKITNLDEPDLVKLRNENKERFVNEAWNIISKAKSLLERRLDRALKNEDELDQIVSEIADADREELSDKQKQVLFAKLRKIQLDDIREIATVLGTLYDKQALANKEATSIVDSSLQIEFNIPRPPKKEIDNED